MSEQRRGLIFGLCAYGLWGAFPLFWPLLEPASAGELLAHRIVWSLAACGVLVVVIRQWSRVLGLFRDLRRLGILTAAAIIVALNWGTYIWAVNNHHVVESSLGYFINPLVSVLFGVVLLSERLRPVQWVAVGVSALAVIVLAVDYGRPPWIALTLAVSFASYGLLKKIVGVPAVDGLVVETTVLALPALVYLGWLQSQATATFTNHGAMHVLLLMSSGLATMAPLLFFAGAANRLPLSTLGLLQYLAPVLQFLIGITVAGETMPPARWIGFGLVWVALIVFTAEAIRHQRRSLQLAVDCVS
jgi:chloramphenicol-sensitive protein RarD